MSPVTTNPPPLIVPIRLDAMCIGTEDSNQRISLFAPSAANFTTLPYPGGPAGANLSDNFTNKPFQTETLPLQPGIHLHWALPDSLCRGVQVTDPNTGAEKVNFLNVPNRWLVTRLLTDLSNENAPKTSLKSWVVESDFLSTDANTYYNHTNIPYNKQNTPISPDNPPFRYMGRAIPLEVWNETSDPTVERLVPLTAIGYGEPRFSSFYPNCKTVFGFQDTFSDVTNFNPNASSLSYSVSGWYSDLDNDPIHTSTDFAQTLYEFQWELLAGSTPASFQQMICSGMVGNVRWNPQTNYISSSSTLNATQVVIGNSPSEGFATLLANKVTVQGMTPEQIERYLEALQLGYLNQLTNGSAMSDLDRDLHKSFFGVQTTDSLWTIVPSGSANDQNIILSDNVSKDLNQLNQLQTGYNGTVYLQDSIQRQVFADWYKYMTTLFPDSGESYPVTSDDIRNYIETFLNNNQTSVLANLNAQILSLQTQITGEIGNGFLLKQIEAPRFYRPNDPTVLISGPDLKPSERYGFDGNFSDSNSLFCRIPSQLLQTFTFNDGKGNRSLQISSLPDLQSTSLPLADIIDQLTKETFFLDQSQLPALLGSAGLNPITALLASLSQEYNQGPDQYFKNHISSGILPSPLAVQIWNQPWNPILLQWDIAFQPIQTIQTDPNITTPTNYDPNLIINNFKLPDGETDLQFETQTPVTQPEEQYIGSTILTPQALQNLQNRANDYLKYASSNTLTNILSQTSDMQVLSQTLSGFNDALGMQLLEMQFSANNPLAHGLDRTFNTNVNTFVSNANDTSPLPENNFNPIRSGFLRIQRLRVVDSFGQYKDYDNPPTIASRSLSTASNTYPVFLPPRFIQPARLQFRWLSALDDSEELNCIETPIHGWILPNYLDTSIILYDKDGNSLGSLFSFDGSSVVFESSPGANPFLTVKASDPNFQSTLDEIIKDVRLNSFVSDFLTKTVNYLQSFVKTLDKSLQFIEPANFSETNSIALLIGRPIALVRAMLKLELQGSPVQNQSWGSLKYNITNANTNDTAEFTNVAFPIRLGSAFEYSDGLVGFYQENNLQTDFSKFYAPQADGSDQEIIAPSETTITLNAEVNGGSTTLFLLMDPRAAVHATTGILPKKKIDIPRNQYIPALNQMFVTFLTAPVITSKDTLSIPYPNANGLQWYWLMKEASDWTILSPIQKVSQQASFISPLIIREGWLKLGNVIQKSNQ